MPLGEFLELGFVAMVLDSSLRLREGCGSNVVSAVLRSSTLRIRVFVVSKRLYRLSELETLNNPIQNHINQDWYSVHSLRRRAAMSGDLPADWILRPEDFKTEWGATKAPSTSMLPVTIPRTGKLVRA
jgi:hypothetical protein